MVKISGLPTDTSPTTDDYSISYDVTGNATKRFTLANLITLVFNNRPAFTIGWNAGSGAWTYTSATTITVPSADAAFLSVGSKIWITQTTSKYFYVTGKSGSVITVNAGTDYTVANAAITNPYFSDAATPYGFPDTFNFTPTLTNLTLGNGTLTGKFKMLGKTTYSKYRFVLGSTSSVGTNPILTFPVTTASTPYLGNDVIGTGIAFASGQYDVRAAWVTTTTWRPFVWGAGGTYVSGLTALSASIPAVWVTTDSFYVEIVTEAA